jgi:Family of unknown function (DUF6428)
MTLQEFNDLLTEHPNKAFQLRLPDGDAVPVSFHITEVGRVQKTFLDCGGRLHDSDTCLLQAWVGSDEDHRIATDKLSGILRKARAFLPNPSIPLEIEYETSVLSQYTISNVAVSTDAVQLQLAAKHTDCLAKDICIPPITAAKSCGCGPGCC